VNYTSRSSTKKLFSVVKTVSQALLSIRYKIMSKSTAYSPDSFSTLNRPVDENSIFRIAGVIVSFRVSSERHGGSIAPTAAIRSTTSEQWHKHVD
jgi:hypothetical protein